jgi:hypothetical protein
MTDNVTGICESKYILIYNLTMTDKVHFKVILVYGIAMSNILTTRLILEESLKRYIIN